MARTEPALDWRGLTATRWVAAVAVPVLFGAVASLEGYPIPTSPDDIAAAATAGVALATLGLLTWWFADQGRPVAVAAAAVAMGSAVAWSLLVPGVTAVRVGDGVVVSGRPVLARFAGVTPWVIVTVGVVGLVEPVLPGVRAIGEPASDDWKDRSRRRATGLAIGGGAAFAALAVASPFLLGAPLVEPTLLGYALGGGWLAVAVAGYLFVRHRIVSPLLALGVVAAAATVAVTAGGSPRGFPTAWPVWAVPGLVAGGAEAFGRWIRGRFGGS